MKGCVHTKKGLSTALEKEQWTFEMKIGRAPCIYMSSKPNVGYWKDEDFSQACISSTLYTSLLALKYKLTI